MELSETVNCLPARVIIEPSVDSKGVLALWAGPHGVCLDTTTAAELLPILEHYIKTGELPE